MNIKPSEYKTKIPLFLYNLYVKTEKWNDTAINLSIFPEKDLAIEVIKDWMIRGGSALGYFNSDYSVFIITKNDETEKFIGNKIKAKQESEEGK